MRSLILEENVEISDLGLNGFRLVDTEVSVSLIYVMLYV